MGLDLQLHLDFFAAFAPLREQVSKMPAPVSLCVQVPSKGLKAAYAPQPLLRGEFEEQPITPTRKGDAR